MTVTFRSSPAATDTGVPVLAGAATSSLFSRAQPLPAHGLFQLHRQDDWLLGSARLPVNTDIESATRQLYRDLVTATGENALCRIWNYVPAINAPGPGGEENYRLFCRARAHVFDDAFGPAFTARIPAASAVGTDGDHLCVFFAAHRSPPRHVENPRQIPSYDYPPDYGPRAPSFARATVLADTVFISGTSSIRGHSTVSPHDTAAQLACTLDNLRIITAEARAPSAATRHLTVYLRHAADLPAVTAALHREFLSPRDHVTCLRADICRAELNIEIEITFPPS
jgi:enamine deaminase RidA (YjgF/YER057c/UK114 family)